MTRRDSSRNSQDEAYVCGTHNGAEFDLLFFRNGKAWGIEFKVGDGHQMTKSLHVALDDLKLERAWIIHPGEKRYAVHEKVEALPLRLLPNLTELL